jgi:hypothetical protein
MMKNVMIENSATKNVTIEKLATKTVAAKNVAIENVVTIVWCTRLNLDLLLLLVIFWVSFFFLLEF